MIKWTRLSYLNLIPLQGEWYCQSKSHEETWIIIGMKNLRKYLTHPSYFVYRVILVAGGGPSNFPLVFPIHRILTLAVPIFCHTSIHVTENLSHLQRLKRFQSKDGNCFSSRLAIKWTKYLSGLYTLIMGHLRRKTKPVQLAFGSELIDEVMHSLVGHFFVGLKSVRSVSTKVCGLFSKDGKIVKIGKFVKIAKL